LTTYGQLRIAPSADIGQLGPAQGQALVYDWKWCYAAQGLLIWGALVLALAIPRANRDRRAILILLPLAVVSLAWFLLKVALVALRIPSSVANQYGMMVDCLVVGLATLWLLAPSLCRLKGGARFFVSLWLICAVTGVGVLSSAYTSSPETVILLTFPVLLAALLLSALTATARRCRGDYSPVRFMLRLGLWTTIGGVVVMYGYFIILTCVLSSGPRLSDMTRVAPQVGLVGLVLGALLYLLNLPYMVLGFVSPFFRERLQRCLGLPPVPRDVDSTASPQTSDSSRSDT